jgi:hypothetical protein
MPTPLKDKLYAAALATPALTAFLGTSPMRWSPTQYVQGQAAPAVSVKVISAPKQYSYTARMATNRQRVQFTIWSKSPEEAEQIEMALLSFLDTFSASGITSGQLSPNQVVNTRDGFYPQAQPPFYWRVVDAQIFNNDAI